MLGWLYLDLILGSDLKSDVRMMVPDQNSEQSLHTLGLIVHKPGSKYPLLEASVQVQVLQPFSPDSVLLGK